MKWSRAWIENKRARTWFTQHRPSGIFSFRNSASRHLNRRVISTTALSAPGVHAPLYGSSRLEILSRPRARTVVFDGASHANIRLQNCRALARENLRINVLDCYEQRAVPMDALTQTRTENELQCTRFRRRRNIAKACRLDAQSWTFTNFHGRVRIQ